MASEPSKTLDDPSPSSSLPPEAETLDNSSSSSSPPVVETLANPSSSPPPSECLDDPSPPSTSPTLGESPNDASSDSPSPVWFSYAESRPILPSPKNSFLWRSSAETKPSMMGAGLENLGNTCFLNAILQCFTHTVPLVQGLRSCNHETPCDRGRKGFCVLCTLRDHIELSLASSGGIISPLNLVENLSYLSSSFRRFEQEDAHEFLQCLLDRLDTCCLDPHSQNQSLSSQKDSLVKQIFGGRLRSQLRCCNCGHCSDTFEPLIDLSLEIEDIDTLPSALQSFTKVEKIDSEARFTCENCKQEVSIEKQLTLDQAPSVAAFHLKRFKNDGSNVEKIDKHVEYPLELDLQPYNSNHQNNNVDLKYELYAVVVHIGFSPCSGHYFCFIRSSPQTWHRLDDSKVTRVREDYVLSQEAYILFYAKQDLPWFSSLMEAQICLNANNVATSPKSVLDDVESICATCPLKASTTCGESNEDKHHVERISIPYALGASDCSNKIDETINDAKRTSNVSPVEASSCNHVVDETRNDIGACPQTPPRSPSPDIYSEEPPEMIYSIPRDHLRMENKEHCKRLSINRALEERKKKEACRLVRSMPNSRRSKLMDAVLGSHSEGSLNRKRQRMLHCGDKGPDGEASPRSACRKLSPHSLMYAVTSSDFC